MTRAPLLPPAEQTLHVLGDLHFGAVDGRRPPTLLTDLQTDAASRAVASLAVGDITQRGIPTEDATALAWLDQLPLPWLPVLGGHDFLSNVRTPAQWAAVYGVESQNYVRDFAAFRLIVLGPSEYVKGTTLRPSTLRWLEQRLGEVPDMPCVVATHAPLQDTVGGDPDVYFTSFDPLWSTQPKLDVNVILARNPNVVAWCSGHTHSSLDAPGFVTTLAFAGGRQVAHVNGSSPYYQDRPGAFLPWTESPIQSVYLTVLDDRVQVRFRDHGAQAWVGPSATGRVVEVLFQQPIATVIYLSGTPGLVAPSRRFAPWGPARRVAAADGGDPISVATATVDGGSPVSTSSRTFDGGAP